MTCGIAAYINFFFSLCRFNHSQLSDILEKVPDMLTLLFYWCYSIKCGKEWSKSCGKSLYEKDRKRYKHEGQKELIESGQVEKWDTTLLCEILLHSSYCFLVNSCVSLEVQCVTKECKAENCKNNMHKSNILKFKSPSDSVVLSNFKILLRQDDLMHLTIASVQGSEGQITVKESLSPGRCAVYYPCSENWVFVCQLRDIRNEFAHMKKYQISEQTLKDKVQIIKVACQSFKDTFGEKFGEKFDKISSEIEIILLSSMSMMILLYQ